MPCYNATLYNINIINMSLSVGNIYYSCKWGMYTTFCDIIITIMNMHAGVFWTAQRCHLHCRHSGVCRRTFSGCTSNIRSTLPSVSWNRLKSVFFVSFYAVLIVLIPLLAHIVKYIKHINTKFLVNAIAKNLQKHRTKSCTLFWNITTCVLCNTKGAVRPIYCTSMAIR